MVHLRMRMNGLDHITLFQIHDNEKFQKNKYRISSFRYQTELVIAICSLFFNQ